MDTLRKIINCEKQAQDLYNEATAYRDSMPELIKSEAEKLEKSLGERSEKWLGEAAKSDGKYMRESAAETERKVAEAKKRLKTIYDENRQVWVDVMFEKLISFDDSVREDEG